MKTNTDQALIYASETSRRALGAGHSRRRFLQSMGLVATGLAVHSAQTAEPPIQGFERGPEANDIHKGWQPVSDRKLRVGIVGYGVCRFGAEFGFQDHPNVEIVGE